MELIVAPIAELRAQVTHHFEEVVGATLDRGDGESAEPHSFTCGITGGSTAMIFLGALRDAAIDWPRVSVYWGDERAVPPDHPDSNYSLAEQLLLTPLGARTPRAFRMPADNPDLKQAARDYAALLPRALDLLILGIGDDGHVCSLFPGHRALLIEDELVTPIEDSPKPPPRRLTITVPYLLRSRRIWVIAVGPQKRGVLQDAINRGSHATPLAMVVSGARSLTIFTDQSLRRGFVAR